MTEDFKAGMDAHSRGVERNECPHPDGSDQREAWLDGWDEAANAPDAFDGGDDA